MHSRETWKLVPSCRLLRIARQRGAGLTTSLVSAHCGPGVHEGYVSHQHDDAVMVLLTLVLWSTPVISTTALTPIYVVHTSYNLLVGGATPEMKPKLRRQPRTNTIGMILFRGCSLLYLTLPASLHESFGFVPNRKIFFLLCVLAVHPVSLGQIYPIQSTRDTVHGACDRPLPLPHGT